MKKTRIFSTMLATVICMASLPAINVFAANQQRTTTLDLTTSEFQNDQKNEDEGWSWDADTLTLTLDNVDFSVAKSPCVFVDGEKVTNIVFSGDNKMTSGTTVISNILEEEENDDAGVVLRGKTKDSVLNLKEKGNSPSIDQPNITFESGTVDIQGGAAITLYTIKVMEATVNIDTTMADSEDGWDDGLYANGSIEIYGGEVNVNAGRIGLFVVGIGAPEPKTGLIIEDGKLDINGKLVDIYVGSGNTKNAVISGGDITLGGNIGIFLYDCEKCEIKGGTFHTDECEKPFAVHRDSSAVFKYAKAYYTELDKAEEAAKALNKDDYKDFSAVEKALAAIDRTKNITEQAAVDKMAKDINDAVAALVYKDADYTELDKAEKAAKALNKDDYKDFTAVDKALAAISRGLNITEQVAVDKMAKDINDAVAALVYKDADYTELDKAEKAAKALNKDDYKDFTAVEKALAVIDRTKNITEQVAVDKMAKDINDAVAALVYKDADYTELDKAEKAAKALNKDDYKDFTAVEKALAAIDRTKNITEQADVDAMAKAINDAVAGLEKKETPAPTPSQPDNTTSSEGSSSTPENNSGDKSSSNTDSSTSSADSSKTDNAANSSSKAASNASTTNPSTGVAGGACALALLSGAAVVMAKRKK